MKSLFERWFWWVIAWWKQLNDVERLKFRFRVLVGSKQCKKLLAKIRLTDNTPETLHKLTAITTHLKAYGQFDKAEAVQYHALSAVSKGCQPFDPAVLTELNALASLYRTWGRSADAERIWRYVIFVVPEPSRTPYSRAVQEAVMRLKNLYQEERRFIESSELESMLLSQEMRQRLDDPVVKRIMIRKEIDLLRNQGNHEGAQALEQFLKKLSDGSPGE